MSELESDASKIFSCVVQIKIFMKYRPFFWGGRFLGRRGSVVSGPRDGLFGCVRNCSLRCAR